MRVLALLVLTVMLAASASARDFYVSNVAGDDLFDGALERNIGTGSGPVRTINRALRAAEKGDRIIIENTEIPYYESISLSSGRHSGYEHRPFRIIGNGAILDGSADVPRDAWEHVRDDIFRFTPPRITFQKLYIDRVPAARRAYDSADSFKLKPLEFLTTRSAIYFRPEETKLPRDYSLQFAAQQTGITLYHVRHVAIENLIVQGFRLDGVNAHDGTVDCVLGRLTCRGNGRSGISVGGASRVDIEDCLVGDNGRAQIRTEGHPLVHIRNTETVANTAPGLVVEGGRVFVDGKRVEDVKQ